MCASGLYWLGVEETIAALLKLYEGEMKDFNFRGLILAHLHTLHSNIQKLNSLDAKTVLEI